VYGFPLLFFSSILAIPDGIAARLKPTPYVDPSMGKQRGGTGRYVETTTLDDVLGVFNAVRGPIITSADIADALDCSPDTARRKLRELHREGRVAHRETAGRVVWWLSADETPDDPETRLKHLSAELDEPITVGKTVYEDGDSHPLDDEPQRAPDDAAPDTDPDSASAGGSITAADDTHHIDTAGSSAAAAETGASPPAAVETAIETTDLPGSGDKLAARQEAVRAAVAYLYENGTATPAEFKRDVYPEHPARHTEGSDPANAWWKRTVSEGLKQVADRTEAIEPADTSGRWTWTESTE
jgi:hypothetical protein